MIDRFSSSSVLALALVLASGGCGDRIDEGDMVQRLVNQSGLTSEQASCVDARASDLPTAQLLGQEPMDEQAAENYRAILQGCTEEE